MYISISIYRYRTVTLSDLQLLLKFPLHHRKKNVGGSRCILKGRILRKLYTASQDRMPQEGPVDPAICPPGLEYLTQIDQVMIHQQIELVEGKRFLHSVNRARFTQWELIPVRKKRYFVVSAFLPFETANKYVIKNIAGQFIYLLTEGETTQSSTIIYV